MRMFTKDRAGPSRREALLTGAAVSAAALMAPIASAQAQSESKGPAEAMSIVRMNPPTLPDAGRFGYSQISIAPPGPLAFVSGQVAWRPDGAPAPASLAEQTAIVVKNLQLALDALKASTENIVQMRVYVTDLRPERQEIALTEILRFLNGVQPSLTGIGVAALAEPGLQIEVEMVVQVAA